MERTELIKFLRERPLLNSWPVSDIEELAKQVTFRQYRAGESVFTSDVRGDDAFLVYRGRVRQSAYDANGKEWWSRLHTVGDIFVQQALYRGRGYASAAKAEGLSEIIRVPAPVFAAILGKHPELWAIIQNPAATRLQAIPLLRALEDEQVEQLALATETKQFKPGEVICTPADPAGYLWIIDWGQVKLSSPPQIGAGRGQRPAQAPMGGSVSAQDTASESILTAGNWFFGGAVRIPQQVGVGATAVTDAKLIRIADHQIEQLLQTVPDFRFLLYNRLDIAQRLRQALSRDQLFSDLGDQHWQQLATIAGWEHVPSNLDVTRQGQYGTKLYVLSDGTALVRGTDEAGRERPRHMIALGEHDVYGINALLHGDRHDATVRSWVAAKDRPAPIDGSDWLTLQKDDVRYLLHTNRALWGKTKLWQAIMVQPKQKRFSWQMEEEEIIHFTRRHQLWLWLRLGAVFFGAALVLAGLQFLGSLIVEGGLASLSSALVLIVLMLPFILWYVNDYLNDYYVITNRRVLRHDRVLLLYENQLEAPIERIQDIVTRSSLVAKVFSYGWMNISTAGIGSIAFDMVPHAEKVESIIRGLQGAVKAGSKAEQRESLRNKILSGLKMRLIPLIPPRALPEGTTLPEEQSGWQRGVERVFRPLQRFWRWLKALPEKIYFFFIGLLPKRVEEQVKKERQERQRKRAAQMQDQIVYRKHILFLIKAAIIPITVIVTTVVLVLFTEFQIQKLPPLFAVPYSVFLLICLGWLWYRVENWRNDKYILTKTHIIDIYALPLGLFERRRQAEWSKVQNANYEIPNFWANLFNFGNVRVETASVEGVLNFDRIPNPRRVQQEIVLRIGEARQAAEQREREQRQSDLSETLQIYNEALQEWAQRNQLVGAPNAPGAPGSPPA